MNKPAQRELWEKIQNFQLDDPTSAFPFSKKLSKENNWATAFTHRAIEEYKKFIFLCCISPTGASPSAIVDEVWHLHLTYTDSYWIMFCKHTLQKDIHHHPSKGGETENEKHINWYENTLQLYEATFDMKPPGDIWPVNQQSTRDIDEKIYEPAFLKMLVFIFAAVLVVFIVYFDLFHTKGQDFLNYYFITCIAGLIAVFISQLHKDQQLKNIIEAHQPKNFTPFQMARFLYGNHRCYQTALVDLLRRGIIATSGAEYKIIKKESLFSPGEENPLLQPLMQSFNEGDTFTYTEGLGLIDRDNVLHQDLERLYRFSQKVDHQKLILPGMVLLLGFARFLQGMSNEKPVGFLVMEMGVFGVLSLVILQSYSYTKTVKQHLKESWNWENDDGYGSNIINNFTIIGTTAIISFAEYNILTNVFSSLTPGERKFGGNGSGGCSSGCGSSCGGGGGCGGGCGGCGGD
jgi:uncharacterized protein (TIGR04222 family)